MVKPNSENRDVRLAALMEWAQAVIEQSHHVVEDSRKTKAEAEAKCLVISEQSRTDDADSALREIEHAAD
jgi:hypothetical protein